MIIAPRENTVERWAWDYIQSRDLQTKRRPPAMPTAWEDGSIVRRLTAPARPDGLHVLDKATKAPRRGALRHARRRAETFHTFLHHEMQAAELMCWALLAFPATPAAFRRGLAAICLEEIRHLQLYDAYLQRAGVAFGDFPVRDWFWLRVPLCRTATQFVAVMGLGLEGGNLDHAQRYEEWFADAGDLDAVHVLQTVRREEVGHVRFAAHWFRHFTGGLDFDVWRAALPAPLSPRLMHGARLNVDDRSEAGFNDDFLEQLGRW
jgi:uncharacterized ferritin-like protein (DUF455 family)